MAKGPESGGNAGLAGGDRRCDAWSADVPGASRGVVRPSAQWYHLCVQLVLRADRRAVSILQRLAGL
ncbi:hypothetical protein D9M68_987440 [compost metagenome]